MVRAAIIGAGMMGTAVASPLADNGHTVRLVGTHLDADIIQSCKSQRYHPRLKRELPPGVQAFYLEDMAQALDGVQIIVCGVNSLGVQWFGHTIAPHLRAEHTIVSVTKGLMATEDGELLLLPDVLAAHFPRHLRERIGVAAIGGPCIAGELAGRRPSCVVFGARDRLLAEWLADTFRTAYYHICTTDDLLGLEICAALKNAYAMANGWVAGLLDREGVSGPTEARLYNLEAAILAQSCTEMDRALHILGGSRSFAAGLPGAGDLYVTTKGGRTGRFGRLLGRGYSCAEARQMMAGETLECVEILSTMAKALPRLMARDGHERHGFPLLQMLIDAVVENKSVTLSLESLFREDD